MTQSSDNQHNRHPKLALTSTDSNYLRVMNPFVPLWWGMAMPGAGHIMIGKMLKGFLLFVWEFFVNTQCHLNEAIVYSCTGHFELAKATLDVRWFFIYIGVYVFTFWDAYRLATEVNQFALLSEKEKAPLKPFKLSFFEVNYLQKMNSAIPLFWSLVTPGLGHIIIRNIFVGVYLLVWYVITVYQSRLLTGIYYIAMGDFHLATLVLNKEWLLYLPSVYCFSACDSFYRVNELNKMFRIEQSRFLKKHYTPKDFKLF